MFKRLSIGFQNQHLFNVIFQNLHHVFLINEVRYNQYRGTFLDRFSWYFNQWHFYFIYIYIYEYTYTFIYGILFFFYFLFNVSIGRLLVDFFLDSIFVAIFFLGIFLRGPFIRWITLNIYFICFFKFSVLANVMSSIWYRMHYVYLLAIKSDCWKQKLCVS